MYVCMLSVNSEQQKMLLPPFARQHNAACNSGHFLPRRKAYFFSGTLVKITYSSTDRR